MANGSIWADSSDADRVLEQVINTATWDSQMKMQRSSQIRQLMEQADPAEFMSYKIQDDQVKAYQNLQQEIVNVSKKRNGRFTDQDMLDINFMINKFERWQNKQLAVQKAFQNDYNYFKSNIGDFDPIEANAAIQNYLQTGEYVMGDMLQVAAINPLQWAQKYVVPGRQPTRSGKIYQGQDGAWYERTRTTYMTPEEREAAFLQGYATNEGLRKGVKRTWDDDLSLEEKQFWLQKLEEYNNNPNTKTRIDNIELYFGMKIFSSFMMQDSTHLDPITPSVSERKKTEGISLVQLNEGNPVELNRDLPVDGHLTNFNYGESEEFTLTELTKDIKLTLDETTIITGIGPDSDIEVGGTGKPASEIKMTTDEGEKSLRGQALEIVKFNLRKSMPVYIGEKAELTDISWEKERQYTQWGLRGKTAKKKGTLTLYNNQPIPEELLSQIEAQKEDEYRDWESKHVTYKPVALMQLEAGVRETLEVMKVFDDNLAELLGIKGADKILGESLKSIGESEIKEGKPELSISKYNTAKGKNYTRKQIEEFFGDIYTIID